MASSVSCDFWRYSISSVNSRSLNLKNLTATIARAGSPTATVMAMMHPIAPTTRPISCDDMTAVRSRPAGISPALAHEMRRPLEPRTERPSTSFSSLWTRRRQWASVPLAKQPRHGILETNAQALLASIRCSRPPLRPAFRRTYLLRTAPTGPWEAQRGCQEGQQPQARHELPLPGLQEPLEGSAVPVPLRGAPQAAQEKAGRGAGEVGGEEPVTSRM